MHALAQATPPTLASVQGALAAFGRAHPQIERIEVFGSVARADGTSSSDVDVLVQFTPSSLPRGLAGFAFLDDLEAELSRKLACPVNLVTADALQTAARLGNPSLPRAVARDARLVYALGPTAN